MNASATQWSTFFVANPDGTYTHGHCLPASIDPGDPEVECWENGSDGWTAAPSPCSVCGGEIDAVVGKEEDEEGGEPPASGSLPGSRATFSPDDNKIRIRALHRLDAELYARVRKAGFAWAPKQELFVAPMWTPEREDLALELCGEIGDEDTSLVDRAEERAERFENYSEKRAADAEGAKAAVDRIAGGIPLGQPILCGHHSERRARKDAEKITSGMTRAVKLWETSKYWTQRAAGAIRHAKYKELPAVRHRRIKGLEADKRKHEKRITDARRFLDAWLKPGLTMQRALGIANYDHVGVPTADGSYGGTLWGELEKDRIGVEAARDHAVAVHLRTVADAERWIAHIDHRLAYERALLGEQGGIVASRFDIAVGGRVLIWPDWCSVIRVNKSNGVVVSVTTNAKYCRVRGIEEVKDYIPPEAGAAEKIAKATKLAPIVNHRGEGFVEMTKLEWDRSARNGCGSMQRKKATAEHGAYRCREALLPGGSWKYGQVFVTDMKVVERPKPGGAPPAAIPAREIDQGYVQARIAAVPRQAPEPTAFDAMKASLKAGVQVVSAPQLFPTPAAIAARMVDEAGIQPGHRVLEPSSGTGSLLKALTDAGVKLHLQEGVEINRELANKTLSTCADFLSLTPADFVEPPVFLDGLFDAITMNPPFANGQDVAHILHARTFLRPGGRLVALCANGPRQAAALRGLADTWEELPEGSFREQGTGVRVVMLTMGARA